MCKLLICITFLSNLLSVINVLDSGLPCNFRNVQLVLLVLFRCINKDPITDWIDDRQ